MPKVMLFLVLLGGTLFSHVQALSLDVNSADSIKSVAASIAKVVVGYYNGTQLGHTPGLLDLPYYWWEGGALFNTLIDYWHYTGDSSYNDVVTQALLFQKGEYNDYMPANQTKIEGNDDQDIWGLAAMSAAEVALPEPPAGTPAWIDLVKNVLDDQISRWDTEACGGGLRWQIFTFNNGYDYKNSPSNGLFFQLAARYARYTSNQTYSTWAEEVYDWSLATSLIDAQWNVYDGFSITTNCTDVNHLQLSYEAATYIAGVAAMYNLTSGSVPKWKSALDDLLNTTLTTFFPDNNILTEVACEAAQTCSLSLKALKGLTARWLAFAMQMAPYTSASILPKLAASAQAAVKQCDASTNQCGFQWTTAASDGVTGLGPQMNALAVTQALLVGSAAVPATGTTGGQDGPSNNSSSTSGTSSATASSGSGTEGNPSSTATGGPSASAKPSSEVAAAGMSLEIASVSMFSVVLALVACILV